MRLCQMKCNILGGWDLFYTQPMDAKTTDIVLELIQVHACTLRVVAAMVEKTEGPERDRFNALMLEATERLEAAALRLTDAA